MLGHPSGNAFAHLQADGFKRVGGIANGDGKVELVGHLVDHEQGPGVRTEVFRHLFHDGLQHRIQVQAGGQCLGHIMKDAQLRELTAIFGGLAHRVGFPRGSGGQNATWRVLYAVTNPWARKGY